MKIKLIFIETNVQKQHFGHFLMCVLLKVAISEVGNMVKVTEDLRECYR
jgi:hypothetical protein